MYAIIRTKKHKSISGIVNRENHTFRRRPTPNADPEKADRNKVLVGQENYADGLKASLVNYEAAGNRIRKDGVLAIEYLLTASPEFFDAGPKNERTARLKDWCDAQIEFVKKIHGAANVLCMYLHLDEKTPHIEVYAVPIDPKGKLNCKHFLGTPSKLSALQTSYAAHNAKLGLKRGQEGSRATHEEVKKFYSLIKGKAKVTTQDVMKAVKIETPTISERVNPADFIDIQQKKIFARISKLFAGTVYENKLIAQARKILRGWKREVDKGKERESELKFEMEKLRIQQARHEKLSEATGALTGENLELKREVRKLWDQNQALKARFASPIVPKL